MTRQRNLTIWMVFGFVTVAAASAQWGEWRLERTTEDSEITYDLDTGRAVGEGGVAIYHGDTVLTADTVSVEQETGEVSAEGNVRIEHGGHLWVGEKIRYNFYTRRMQTEQFRTGAWPLFASGSSLDGDITNEVYTARGAALTTDDYEDPFWVVKAHSIRVIPGDRVTARHATVYLGSVPVFYWPYYSRRIGRRQNQVLFLPGYRSAYGPYIYSGYAWYLNDELDITLHADYRAKRGFGGGPDLNFDYGHWGKGGLSYYYTYDDEPGIDAFGNPIDPSRQLLQFDYIGNPATNLYVKGQFSYESDPLFRQDFFESAFQQDPQPITFGQVRRHWNDLTLEVYAQGRVNDFYDTVERLPDVRLSVLPTQVGSLPLVYQSENSAGHYSRAFAETNGPSPLDVDGERVDTFHQISIPFSLFGWLFVEPRAGGRATYYTDTQSSLTNTEAGWRSVFNTGVALSTKASRVWQGASSRTFDIEGLRHIIQPRVNYTYVPTPDRVPSEIPQFDYQLSGFYPPPLDFPDFNSIDGIDARNVVRLGLRNRLQTKRRIGVENLVDWDAFIDCRLDPDGTQSRWSNLYSDFALRPRTWLILRSQLQLDVESGRLQQALNSIILQPGTRWSWGLSQWYVRENAFGETLEQAEENNSISSRFYYRFNENCGFRMSHRFQAVSGRLEEQYYTLYRDLRSFTTAITFRHRRPVGESDDFSVALTLSLKASPRYKIGQDTVQPSALLGY